MNDKDLPTTEYDETEIGTENGSDIEAGNGIETGAGAAIESATVSDPAAEAYAGDPELDAVAEEAVKKERRRRAAAAGGEMTMAKTMKFGALICVSFAVLLFASIAWFTMSREVGTNALSMMAEGMPYSIQTRSESGYYSDKFETLPTQAMEWQISSDHNFDNHSSAIETGEVEPSLEPGDSGSLEFRVDPQTFNSITVDCLFEMKAYKEEIVKDGNGDPVTDDNGDPVTTLTEITGNTAGFIEGHILLFSGIDENNKYTDLIDNNNVNLERILANQTYNIGESTYTTIYWYWPEHLSDLTDSSKIEFASSEQNKVIAYVARNKGKFFKNCTDTSEKVLSDFTALAAGTSTDQVYNHYSLMYDNADLEIGNFISYIILSMQVKQN